MNKNSSQFNFFKKFQFFIIKIAEFCWFIYFSLFSLLYFISTINFFIQNQLQKNKIKITSIFTFFLIISTIILLIKYEKGDEEENSLTLTQIKKLIVLLNPFIQKKFDTQFSLNQQELSHFLDNLLKDEKISQKINLFISKNQEQNLHTQNLISFISHSNQSLQNLDLQFQDLSKITNFDFDFQNLEQKLSKLKNEIETKNNEFQIEFNKKIDFLTQKIKQMENEMDQIPKNNLAFYQKIFREFLTKNEEELLSIINSQEFQSQITEIQNKNQQTMNSFIDEKTQEYLKTNSIENIIQSIKDLEQKEKILIQDEIQEKIQEIISQPKFSQNIDFALESNGGRIVYEKGFTSKTFTKTSIEKKNIFGKIFQKIVSKFSSKNIHKFPELVIQRSLDIGDCWPFEGKKGNITIKLNQPIKVTSVGLYHIPKNVIPSIHSAPKNFRVYGIHKNDDFSFKLLGEFYYDIEKLQVLQVFQINNENEKFQFLLFEFIDNYGGDYTCLYRISIFGNEFE
ncbi:klaroid isoform a-related [Anaeramoeba ignava]|uniref:Klaroid isoform a-related n=1 Tax=Anaeramoeba ignava TaxID=1746090 RepID=A0A9Q0LM27_ANAIG|nr:klaroid isoform a-related [Anaeramoeba ignava]